MEARQSRSARSLARHLDRSIHLKDGGQRIAPFTAGDERSPRRNRLVALLAIGRSAQVRSWPFRHVYPACVSHATGFCPPACRRCARNAKRTRPTRRPDKSSLTHPLPARGDEVISMVRRLKRYAERRGVQNPLLRCVLAAPCRGTKRGSRAIS